MKSRRLVAALMVMVGLLGQELTTSQPVQAYPSANVELVGHGWGHGRGMSQFGSLGSALGGADHRAILSHYYSNTTEGSVPNVGIGVRIVSNDDRDLILFSNAPYSVAGRAFPGGVVVRIRSTGSNNFAVEQSGGCGGPGGWAPVFTTTGPVTASPSNHSPGNNVNYMIERCAPEGTRGYRGEVTILQDGGTTRVVNSLLLEDYLRGVVPRESPASWGDLGGGAGMNQLRAQSVAARSYSIAAPAYPYATTCDTISCQVYGGAFLNGQRIEDNRTDAAIAHTAGQIRRLNGAVARTEFSSSSGGFTAGGTFPAVPDPADENLYNPNFRWSASVPVSKVESSYPSIGSLLSISVNARNGLGSMGGRVLSMTIEGTAGSVTISGAHFRAKTGLKSDWFAVQNTPSGGVNGYWLAGTDGGVFTFGAAAFNGSAGAIRLRSPVVSMAARSPHGYWLAAADGGVFSFGDAAFHGSAGNVRLNRPIVGMAATPSGHGYWLVASDGGIFTYGDAVFHGSTGNLRLNQPIVGMARTPDGGGYWLVAADGGIFTFGNATFHGSTGGKPLRQPIVGMAATPTGNGYWLVSADGGVFTFGGAPFHNSLPGIGVSAPVTGVARTASGNGYLMTSANGRVFSFGDAPQFGGLGTGFRGRVTAVAPLY